MALTTYTELKASLADWLNKNVGRLDIIVVIIERQVADVLAADLLAHQAADLELDDSLRGHFDLFESARVLCPARSAIARFEHAELSELETVAFSEFVDDRVEERLDDLLGYDLGDTSAIRDSIDEFFLGDSFHQLPPWRRLLRARPMAWVRTALRSACIK